VTQRTFDLSNFKLHRRFFLVSYQLLLVSADNGCSKRDESHLMQPPSSLFTPTSLCTVAPSPKKILGREIFVFLRGGGGCTQARANWTWLLPSQCNEEQCPLTYARIHLVNNLSNFNIHTHIHTYIHILFIWSL